MQYVIIGRDGTDPEAPARRQAVRAEHLKRFEQAQESGVMLYGLAILNKEEEMIGSVVVGEFETLHDVDLWLEEEPYVRGEVWKVIEVHPAKVVPACLQD